MLLDLLTGAGVSSDDARGVAVDVIRRARMLAALPIDYFDVLVTPFIEEVALSMRTGSGPTSVEPSHSVTCRAWMAPSSLADRPVWDHARMDFDLAPPNGVGPLRIGMTRHAANTALDSLRDLSAISESDRSGQHVFRLSGLMISIHCARDMLEAIELGRPSSQKDRVLFQGVDVFAPSAREVVRRVGELTSIEEDPDDDASFIAPDLLLSFWRPFAADDEPEEEQGYYFSSVLLARPGYYDTPVQAAERLQQSS
ncbi:hypothetical protein RKD31_000962 [Streptomyces sp. SAI-163]|uniref:hypothetical protein n=1 Tax=Streptomyces sp. SAI-163 TaxID=3377735 RepID=UPI003C7EC7D7